MVGLLIVEVMQGVKVVPENGLEGLKGSRVKELLLLEPGPQLGLKALLLHLHLLTPQFVHTVEKGILHSVHANQLQIRLSKPNVDFLTQSAFI